MTKGERQRLVSHLEMTEAWLKSEVNGLSKAQLEFKPTPDSWSVANVVEHLGIAEPQYWQNLQDGLAKPPSEERGKGTDADILWYGIDHGNRARTGEAREPKGQFESTAKALESFVKLRAKLLDYARTTDADLRGHDLGKGAMDTYQWFVMISSHAQRHIMRIREIKADPKWPAK